MTEINDLLKALHDGSITLEELAQVFRQRTWPHTSPPPASTYEEMAKRAVGDPRPDVPNSFDDVIAAYGRGELTEDEYEVLGQAVAESLRSNHQES
jgi:hypothetical protein